MDDRKLEKKILIATVALLTILFLNLLLTPVQAINWSSDTQLTTDLGWDKDPSIFQTADGTIWVVWSSDRIDVQNDIYYKTSANNGASWTSDNRLTFDTEEDITPSIIQTADGTIWVVWASYRTGNYELFFKTSANKGVSWSPETPLTSNSSRDVGPSIMQHHNGTIWVVWASDREGTSDLFYKTSNDNGSTWSSVERLTINPGWDLHPSIIQAVDGTIWVVWSSYRTDNYELFYKKSTDNGASWTSDTPLTTNKVDDEAPSIIQARDGSLWVVWQLYKGKQYDIYYKTSNDNGATWSPDNQLTTDTGDDIGPTIMNSQEGRIWVAWASARDIYEQFDIYYKTSGIISAHDVAVISVTPLKTIAGSGYSAPINVTVENQGNYTETFDVAVYYDSSLISTASGTPTNPYTISLPARSSTTITFVWNTTSVTKYIDYTISAEASQVPDETDIADNTCTDGTVKVTIPGDVSGDAIVDAFDVFDLGKAYGSTPSSPNWNPNADINSDGIVNDLDLDIIGKNYGEIGS